jgi:hypothetical protein
LLSFLPLLVHAYRDVFMITNVIISGCYPNLFFTR